MGIKKNLSASRQGLKGGAMNKKEGLDLDCIGIEGVEMGRGSSFFTSAVEQ